VAIAEGPGMVRNVVKEKAADPAALRNGQGLLAEMPAKSCHDCFS
jgi:hypothetical protein